MNHKLKSNLFLIVQISFKQITIGWTFKRTLMESLSSSQSDDNSREIEEISHPITNKKSNSKNI